MKRTIAALALSLLIPAAGLAQAPATQPTTQPTTQPAAQALESRVLVVPFTPVETSDPDWIGRAVQQSLLADLSRGTAAVQAAGEPAKITTVAEAIDLGQNLNAR